MSSMCLGISIFTTPTPKLLHYNVYGYSTLIQLMAAKQDERRSYQS